MFEGRAKGLGGRRRLRMLWIVRHDEILREKKILLKKEFKAMHKKV